MPRLITLLTDFGTADGYVGEMKGVLASLAPLSPIVDIAHDVSPHDVEGARLARARYWRRFPEGTVHLVVIDPGVGSARGALAAASEGRFLVGPDNGVLAPALLPARARWCCPPRCCAPVRGACRSRSRAAPRRPSTAATSSHRRRRSSRRARRSN